LVFFNKIIEHKASNVYLNIVAKSVKISYWRTGWKPI